MKKLKSDRSITGLIPAIASLLIFALSTASFGIEIGLNVLGMVVISYALAIGLWPSIRTGNPYYLVSFFYMLVLGSFFIILEPGMLKRYGGRLDSVGGFLVILIYFFFLWLVFLLINKKLKWRGREIMELVAVDVMEGEDSYTDRPRPVGKIAGSRSDFIGFAKYFLKLLNTLLKISYIHSNFCYSAQSTTQNAEKTGRKLTSWYRSGEREKLL